MALGLYPIGTNGRAWRELRFDQHDRPIPIHLVSLARHISKARQDSDPDRESTDIARRTMEQFEYLMTLD